MKQLLSCLDRGGERKGQTHRYRQTGTDTPCETGKNRCTERVGQTGRDAPKETGTDVPRKPRTDAPSETRTEAPRKTD